MLSLYSAKIGALGLSMIGEYYAFLPPRTTVPNKEDRKVFGNADVITIVAGWCPYLVLVSFSIIRLVGQPLVDNNTFSRIGLDVLLPPR